MMFKKLSAIHRPFTWMGDHVDPAKSEFIEITHDITRGIVMTLDMIQNSDLEQQAMEAGSDRMPILDAMDREFMLVFAKAAAKLLHMDAEKRIGWMNQESAKKGVKS